ncbi:GPR1/FUN34/YaaH family transporter [Kitasatospora sp. NPDC096147]|uniref:GPR1/FUN34/YaaH family transporter n=1 Tax=Kitasatospora sp. NPDC096147 TaxID=3364093 RepID=UPI0038283956
MSNEASGANIRTADAGNLGYLALGLTLLAYGLLGTGILSGAGVKDAAGLAHLVGGLTLFVAGLWQLRSGDGFTGTAFTALGAFWAVWSAGGGASKNATGLFLLLWALLVLSLALAAWGSGLLGRLVWGLFFVSLVLSALGVLTSTGSLGKAGAWLAAVAGLAAWYSATASLAEGGWGRALLPTK